MERVFPHDFIYIGIPLLEQGSYYIRSNGVNVNKRIALASTSRVHMNK